MQKALAGVALGTALALSFAVTPAQASSQASAAFCGPIHWQDANTYGTRCVGGDSNTRYRAKVLCSINVYAYGPVVVGSGWSYAYCTRLGSGVHIKPGAKGQIEFF
ncbi:hypothetical protein [Dactylosporangium sp. NPDC000521]|uniref:hypothetical protein n=1 Tax=Dactylosporangium sp. NPDC000521 TaxID=3363975 RepID=UPI003698FBC4